MPPTASKIGSRSTSWELEVLLDARFEHLKLACWVATIQTNQVSGITANDTR